MARYHKLIDLAQAVQRGEVKTEVFVDNDAIYAYSEDDPECLQDDLYDGEEDPRQALIELLGDLGVKARKP